MWDDWGDAVDKLRNDGAPDRRPSGTSRGTNQSGVRFYDGATFSAPIMLGMYEMMLAWNWESLESDDGSSTSAAPSLRHCCCDVWMECCGFATANC